MKLKTGIFLVLIATLSLGCRSEKKASNEVKNTNEESVTEWVRPAAKGGTTVAYFSYRNSLETTDTLWQAESEVAGLIQIHESSEGENGMMEMNPQDFVILESGETVYFEPGGLHVMLIQLGQNLAKGDSVEIKLHFSKAGEKAKKLPVIRQR